MTTKSPLTRIQENLQAQNDLLDDLRNLLQELVLVQENTIKELQDTIQNDMTGGNRG